MSSNLSILQAGCHILVATPFRLKIFYNDNYVKFDNLKYLVLDAVDFMIHSGFEPTIYSVMKIASMIPTDKRRILMFSTNNSFKIERLANKYLQQPILLDMRKIVPVLPDVTKNVVVLKKREKLLKILNEAEPAGTIVFVQGNQTNCQHPSKARPLKFESPKPSTMNKLTSTPVQPSAKNDDAPFEGDINLNDRTLSPTIPASLNLNIQNDKDLSPKAMIKHRTDDSVNGNALNHAIDGRVIQKFSAFKEFRFCLPSSSSSGSLPKKPATTSNPGVFLKLSSDVVDAKQEEPMTCSVKSSVDEVCDYIRSLPGCSDCADAFAKHGIDGQALVLLNEDHLVKTMKIKLGPALKIMSRIETISHTQ